MKLVRDLKIGTKLIASFLIVALISLGVGITAIIFIQRIIDNSQRMYDVDTKPMYQIASVAIGFKQIQTDMRDVLVSVDVTTKASIAGKIPGHYVNIENMLEGFSQSMGESQEIKDEYLMIEGLIGKSKEIQEKVISLGIEGKSNEAVELLAGEWTNITSELETSVNRMFNYKITEAGDTVDKNQEAAKQSVLYMGLIIGFAILFALTIGVIAAFTITKPVKKLSQAADRLALGDIDVEIQTKSNDEIGRLSKSFSHMAQNIRSMAKAVEKVAEGDLEVEIDIKSDKDILALKLKEMVSNIKGLSEETQTLTNEAVEGNLKARVDVSLYRGAWHNLAKGINDILGAVTEPLKESIEVMAQMAEGEFNIAVTGDYKGDHGAIKNSLNTTIDTINEYFGKLQGILEEVAVGNLDVDMTKEWKGNFSNLKEALIVIIDTLNKTMTEINSASNQVALGANQLSSSSQDLSQGATQQASSAQEITAAMAQINSQTKQNTLNASRARDLADTAKENAEHGNEKMIEMLKAMKEIDDASHNISKIVKVIDDIARQTNILALNASVEAARAGQHGKGFAVVAEEVRNLALRSSKAAKETTTMIESSIKRVEGGTIIANETAKALEQIVEDTSTAATLVEEIAIASKEQEAGISQINVAIEEVAKVTQMTTSTAEESAAGSEELASQAQILKERISTFKLKTSNPSQEE